ncbi:hypothetical protein ACQPZP_25455 [Spirillospora sp. CA-142024]|uniref:hypothetical protein n=1 Tax=Spirillospora sp. CA-142024 TaxID=3240036 RepID=UPI003D91E24E
MLVYGGFGDGVCYDGEPHFLNDSGPYSVPVDDSPPDAQQGWRWCGRCQALVYSGNGNGVCHDGEAHDFTGSVPYFVHFGETPEGAQDGWRWCSRCQVLMYTGFGDGLCWDGKRHYPDDSLAYSVTFEEHSHRPPPPPSLPPPVEPPRIDVTEAGEVISVFGEGFTPGGGVRLSFVRGPDVKKVELTATGEGRITHVETTLDAEHVGGAVIGSDITTQHFGIGRTLRSFPAISRPTSLPNPDLEPL